MVHTLLKMAPTNQTWALADLTECILRITEATDKVEDMVQKLNNLGSLGDSANNTSIKETTQRTRNRHIRTFPKMRTSTKPKETGCWKKNYG